MKPLTITGIVLIVVGIIGYATGGLSFTHEKKVVDLGSVQISRKTQDTLPLSPIFSTVSLVAGIALAIVGARAK
jgi:hypothetical protein